MFKSLCSDLIVITITKKPLVTCRCSSQVWDLVKIKVFICGEFSFAI